jgi:hypothetical protein
MKNPSKLRRYLIIGIILILVLLLVKAAIFPTTTITLKGNFDPSLTRIYVNNKRLMPADLGVKKYSFSKLPGTYSVLVSGPSIKSVTVDISAKPVVGAREEIELRSGLSALQIAEQTVKLSQGSSISTAKQFGDDWIGVSINDPSANYIVMRALHYTYEKGVWTVINPSSRLDTSQAVFKNAPKGLITFLTDTAAD